MVLLVVLAFSFSIYFLCSFALNLATFSRSARSLFASFFCANSCCVRVTQPYKKPTPDLENLQPPVMDTAPPPYSEHRTLQDPGPYWNWKSLDKYITPEKITPRVYFSLKATMVLYAKRYGQAKFAHDPHQSQNFDYSGFEKDMWWARTCATIISRFTESRHTSYFTSRC